MAPTQTAANLNASRRFDLLQVKMSGLTNFLKRIIEGDKKRTRVNKFNQKLNQNKKLMTETKGITSMNDNAEHSTIDSLQASTAAIHAKIKAVCSDIRMELTTLATHSKVI